MKNSIDGKVTLEKLTNWLNKEFQRAGLSDYKTVRIYNPMTIDTTETTAKLIVIFANIKNHGDWGSFPCHYTLSAYTNYLKKGYKMFLKFNDPRKPLAGMSIDVTKINTISYARLS